MHACCAAIAFSRPCFYHCCHRLLLLLLLLLLRLGKSVCTVPLQSAAVAAAAAALNVPRKSDVFARSCLRKSSCSAMPGSSGDLIKVLQGLSTVLNQIVKTEAPVAVDRLTRIGQHGRDVVGSFSHAAWRSTCSPAAGAAAYPPPAPYAPKSLLPKVTPEQLLHQSQHQHSHHDAAPAAATAAHIETVSYHYDRHSKQYVEQTTLQPQQAPAAAAAAAAAQQPIAPAGTDMKAQAQFAIAGTKQQQQQQQQQPVSRPTAQPTAAAATFDDRINTAPKTSIATEPDATVLQGTMAAAVEPPRKGRTRAVPSTPLARVLGFGQLAAGLAMGTVAEALRQRVGNKSGSSGSSATKGASSTDSTMKGYMVSDANAERLAEGLCRMRGAALKLGQMLSIQDESLIPPQLSKALERVRSGADVMPSKQLHAQLDRAFGSDWRDKLIDFDETPLAAASIGQVHKAKLADGTAVAMKIQYPGVANSIESDLSNLERLVTITNILPPGKSYYYTNYSHTYYIDVL
jgi:ABC1 atypical kinase-like domain